MGKPFCSREDQLEALVKAYQYLAGLISDREVWVELEKVLTHYFKADLVAFLGRRPDGEIVLQHLSPPRSGHECPSASGDRRHCRRGPGKRLSGHGDSALTAGLCGGFSPRFRAQSGHPGNAGGPPHATNRCPGHCWISIWRWPACAAPLWKGCRRSAGCSA